MQHIKNNEFNHAVVWVEFNTEIFFIELHSNKEFQTYRWPSLKLDRTLTILWLSDTEKGQSTEYSISNQDLGWSKKLEKSTVKELQI